MERERGRVEGKLFRPDSQTYDASRNEKKNGEKRKSGKEIIIIIGTLDVEARMGLLA